MCEPVTALALVAGAASVAAAGTSYYAQSEQADAQSNYQNTLYSRTSKIATASYLGEVNASNLRMEQERQSTGQQAEQGATAINDAKSTTLVSAASAGVGGNSINLLLRDFDRMNAQNTASASTNFSWLSDQSRLELEGAKANALSRIASATPQPIQGPNALATGLSIVGTAANTGVGAYNLHAKYGAPKV